MLGFETSYKCNRPGGAINIGCCKHQGLNLMTPDLGSKPAVLCFILRLSSEIPEVLYSAIYRIHT